MDVVHEDEDDNDNPEDDEEEIDTDAPLRVIDGAALVATATAPMSGSLMMLAGYNNNNPNDSNSSLSSTDDDEDDDHRHRHHQHHMGNNSNREQLVTLQREAPPRAMRRVMMMMEQQQQQQRPSSGGGGGDSISTNSQRAPSSNYSGDWFFGDLHLDENGNPIRQNNSSEHLSALRFMHKSGEDDNGELLYCSASFASSYNSWFFHSHNIIVLLSSLLL
jgi:hypothetical protein